MINWNMFLVLCLACALQMLHILRQQCVFEVLQRWWKAVHSKHLPIVLSNESCLLLLIPQKGLTEHVVAHTLNDYSNFFPAKLLSLLAQDGVARSHLFSEGVIYHSSKWNIYALPPLPVYYTRSWLLDSWPFLWRYYLNMSLTPFKLLLILNWSWHNSVHVVCYVWFCVKCDPKIKNEIGLPDLYTWTGSFIPPELYYPVFLFSGHLTTYVKNEIFFSGIMFSSNRAVFVFVVYNIGT